MSALRSFDRKEQKNKSMFPLAMTLSFTRIKSRIAFEGCVFCIYFYHQCRLPSFEKKQQTTKERKREFQKPNKINSLLFSFVVSGILPLITYFSYFFSHLHSLLFFIFRCPFLHRTAGDTERRYHLRYYKTCMCVHDTDSRGFCVKNGQHCAFAHGAHDQRPPVYDIKELEALQSAESAVEAANGGPNVLDKERNLMNEDPKWQDTNYVLANYKTEPCKRPPRLCRQGYACPQYHNSKDKRRSPRKFKYRSTPCPNVKHGEEWGEPDNCEAGDNCQYCHTRTEQQFHPEIYKSTKCNDVQQQGYCPRSVFCAFAHVQCMSTIYLLIQL